MFGNLLNEENAENKTKYEQINLFTNYEELERKRNIENKILQKEKKLQKTIIYIKNKYGKNVILKAMNLEKGATTLERNGQIGGHKK